MGNNLSNKAGLLKCLFGFHTFIIFDNNSGLSLTMCKICGYGRYMAYLEGKISKEEFKQYE